MRLLGREKHFTGILMYKTVIIKIKPWTCDNKTTSRPGVYITLPPTLQNVRKNRNRKKEIKVIHLNTPLGT